MAKILLVEDDNNLRDIYGERLMAEGYEIISASDGEEALQLAAQQKPDLIISDVMMPKISGFDMLDILRQTADTKDIKIIMMTALSQAEDKSRADKLGADKYLVKSQVTLEDVARVVHDILGDAPAEDSDELSQGDNLVSNTQTATTENVTDNIFAEASTVTENVTINNNIPDPTPTASNSTPQIINPLLATNNPTVAVPTAPLPEPTNPAQPTISVNTPSPTLPINDTTNQAQASPSVTPTVASSANNTIPTRPVSNPTTLPQQAVTTNTAVNLTNSVSPANDVNAVVFNTAPINDLKPSIAQTTNQDTLNTQNNINSLPTAVISDANIPTPSTPLSNDINPPNPISNSQTNSSNNTVITNPISDAPSQQISSISQAEANSDATSTEQEISEVAKQIESFMASNNPVANHTEPLKEPTEQDLIHAQNANEDPRVVTASVAPNIQNTATLNPAEQVAPPVTSNPSVPPIIKPQINTANPEPVSNRKKIIQPINDTSLPDIHKLYEQQMAAEAAAVSGQAVPQTTTINNSPNATIPNPQINSVNSAPNLQEEQVFNPITTNTDPPAEVELPALEQVDINAIAGANEPVEDTSFNIPAPPPSNPTLQEPNATIQNNTPLNNLNQPAPEPTNSATNNAPTTPLAPANPSVTPQATSDPLNNPNDPSNFAL